MGMSKTNLRSDIPKRGGKKVSVPPPPPLQHKIPNAVPVHLPAYMMKRNKIKKREEEEDEEEKPVKSKKPKLEAVNISVVALKLSAPISLKAVFISKYLDRLGFAVNPSDAQQFNLFINSSISEDYQTKDVCEYSEPLKQWMFYGKAGMEITSTDKLRPGLTYFVKIKVSTWHNKSKKKDESGRNKGISLRIVDMCDKNGETIVDRPVIEWTGNTSSFSVGDVIEDEVEEEDEEEEDEEEEENMEEEDD